MGLLSNREQCCSCCCEVLRVQFEMRHFASCHISKIPIPQTNSFSVYFTPLHVSFSVCDSLRISPCTSFTPFFSSCQFPMYTCIQIAAQSRTDVQLTDSAMETILVSSVLASSSPLLPNISWKMRYLCFSGAALKQLHSNSSSCSS